MRSILFHCKKFDATIGGISTRGVEIEPEVKNKHNHEHEECIVVFITVEKKDNVEQVVPQILKEIKKFCEEVKETRIVLCPFAHLSNELASFKTGISFFDTLESGLKEKFQVSRVHFGSDKELLIHLFGHPGNARYREF